MDDAAQLESISRAGETLADRLLAGGCVVSFGNGGSMSDAMHFAGELSGRFREDRRPLAAIAISDPAHLTATANDYGYEWVFSRFIQGQVGHGDVVVAISTSGASPNVVRGAEAATERGATVIALTGRAGSALGAHADIEICTPAGRYADRVQELHIKVLHILVETVERRLADAAG